jgi:small subunit ribosomal protein S15
MHARRRGVSASKRPMRKDKPEWVTLGPKELEKIIIDLAKEGNTSAKIGLVLRDQYGIPSVRPITKKSILTILEDNGLKPEIPEDIANLMKKAVALSEHLKLNKKDLHNKRSLHLTEAKIIRLQKYYKKRGVLPATWKYSLKTAKLYVE